MTDRPWLQQLPAGRARRHRRFALPVAGRAAWRRASRKYADRTAYSFMGKDLSYGRGRQAEPRLRRLPAGAGPGKGDRVAVDDAQLPQYPIAVAGILRAGLIVVNVNPLYTPRELEHQLKDSGSKAIVIMENFGSTLQQVHRGHAGQARGAARRWATGSAC